MLSLSKQSKQSSLYFSISDVKKDLPNFLLFLDQITIDTKYNDLFTYKLFTLTGDNLLSVNDTEYCLYYELDSIIEQIPNTVGLFSSFTMEFASRYADTHNYILKDNIIYDNYIPLYLVLKVFPINVYPEKEFLIVNDNLLTTNLLNEYYKYKFYQIDSLKHKSLDFLENIYDKYNLSVCRNMCLSKYIYIPRKHNINVLKKIYL